MSDEFLWVEKYRPKTIDECILPDSIKKTFKDFVAAGELPNLLLAGPPGIGKTTVAKALCAELGVDYYVINGSDEGRFLDTVRNQAKNFASTVSLTGDAKHKVIIIDEADNTTHDVQLLLRANIESFYKNCRFIFTCNYKNRIIEPLHSRCSVIDFSLNGKQKPGSLLPSSSDSTISWTPNGLMLTKRSSQNSSTNTSQTGDVYLTSAKDILSAVKLTQESSQVFRM